MLPFGLTTDVSAAALTAGAGGVPASGPVANTKASGFANELKTAAGQGAAPLAEGSRSGAPVAGVAGQAPAASPRLQVRGIAVAVERAADVAVPSLPTALPVPPGDALVMAKFEGHDRASIKPVELPGPEVAEGLPELLTEPLAEPLTDPLADMPVEAALVAAASVPAAPVPAVVAVSGDGGGEAVALVAGQSPAGGAVPGTPPLSGAAGPAPLPGQVPGGAPLPVEAGSKGVTDAAPEVDGQDIAEAGLPTRVTGEQAAAAETARQVPVTKDRRWRTELPQELRAQTHVPVRAAAATAPATGQPAAEVALLPNGKTLPAQDSERAVQIIAAVIPGSARAKPAEPALQQPVQGAVTEPALPGQTAAPTVPAAEAQPLELLATGQTAEVAGSEKTDPNTAAPVNSQSAAGAAAQTAAAQPPAQLAGQSRSVAQAPAEALPAPVLADDQFSAGSSAEVDNGTLTTGMKTGADQSALQRIGAGNADEAQVAGARPITLASAAPASMAAADVPQDDADLSLIKTEPGPVGEAGAATVRGGDLSGAARTESLQTPNQTQSAHVATQVAAEVARNLKSGQTRFQMRFDPPELGRVEVHMKVKSDGSVQTHLIVDRPETLDMFLRDQRGLERALENAGLKPDSENMQFSLKQDGNRDFASGRDQSGGQAPEQGSIGSGGSEDADPVLEEVVRLTLARQRGGLDMKV